jgi:hypothetical protein
MRRLWRESLFVLSLCSLLQTARAADHVDITWMSISNLHLDFGSQGIVVDGYISRLPEDLFYGGGGGLAWTHRSVKPDEAAVREVFDAIGGRSAVDKLINGHSHFDHSFDLPVWARLSGAPIISPPTTCLQVRAAKIPARQCRAVFGGERIRLGAGLTMHVVRWNHSGDPATNPEQHDAKELLAVPLPDAGGGLKAGVAEDFPNGGGNRAFLFVIDAPQGPVSLFFQNSASAVDLSVPIVIKSRNYGAPIENLRSALRDAGLQRVDLWIGTGGAEIASLLLPLLKPVAYMPVHWDGLWGAFKAGPPAAFSDARLERLLAESGVALIRPMQYMDKWRLDRSGVHALDNQKVKSALGFR